MTGPMTQLIEIPLVGMTREQGQDSGGFSYSVGVQNTGQNEWRPIGALSEASPSGYYVSTYSTNLPINTIQSPDLLFFENRRELHAINYEKCYSVTGSSSTLQKPTSNLDAIYDSLSSALSWQTPLETISLKVFDFSSANLPITYSYSLDCFISFSRSVYYDENYNQTFQWGLSFFDKNSGKRWNDQIVFFPVEEYDVFSKTNYKISNKQFITESSDGKIGVIGYFTGGSNPNRVQEYWVQTTKYDLPDLQRNYKCDEYDPSANLGYLAGFDGQILGYYKFLSDDGVSIIDIIAIYGEIVPGTPEISITSRIDRVVATTLTISPTVASPYTAEGSILVSELTDDAIVCWSFVETAGANTGVSYRKLNIDKATGAISFNGAEVVLYTDLKANGDFINAFSTYNLRESAFVECIFANRMMTSTNIGTYKYNQSVPGQPFSLDYSLFNFVFNSQPIKVENSFIAIGSFKNGDDLEFGQCYLNIYNYDTSSLFYSSQLINIKPTGVCGYNETYGQSYAQTGFCDSTKIMMSMCSSDKSTYSRTTQIGICESLRPVKFNGEVYLFSGFQYQCNPKTGLERVGVYTTPRFSITGSGAGTFTGTYYFKMCWRSFGGDGPESEAIDITVTTISTLTIQANVTFLDIYNIAQTFSDFFSDNIGLYCLDSSDGLYKEVKNTIPPLSVSISNFGFLSFDVDVSTGSILFGDIAQFELGEAPQVGLNSPRLPTLALGRVVCSDEFSEKIYTSKQQSETTAAEFSDVLFINASPATEPITELAELNNALVVFSDNSIYAITGNLPDSFGNQSLSEWQLISNSVGSNSAASTIVTDNGVYFSSDDGIYLLNRGFQLQQITKPKGFLPYSNPSLSQDFWWRSSSQDGTDNIIFSTSSIRSRFSQFDYCDNFSILDSIFIYNERYGTLGVIGEGDGTFKVLECSGIWGSIFSSDKKTVFLNKYSSDPDNAADSVYDTGYFCPFGQFTYGQTSSVYIKLFKVGDIVDPYPVNLLPSVTIYVRDDVTGSEFHETTQTMESPIPTEDSRVFLWRVRLTNRRTNAIRIILSLGEWGLAGLALEVIPQSVGGVKRQLQGVT